MSATSRVHIYCRVSTAGQEEGYSLDSQEAACRTWCADRGLPIASVAHEVWSGYERHRPQLDAMLDRLERGDTVLCYELWRFSRNQMDQAILVDRIEAAGASLQLVTEDFEQSPTGVFLRNAKTFAGELGREKTREATMRGRRSRALSGKPLPGAYAPYGCQWADEEKTRLVRDEAEARVVRDIFDLYLRGLSLRGVAGRLEGRGIPTPSGKARWSASSVRHILTRPVYTGSPVAYRERLTRRRSQGGDNGPRYIRSKVTSDEWITIRDVAPVIVSAAEFAAVAERLASSKQRSVRNNQHPEATLLRNGHAFCGHCGWQLTVQNYTDGRSASYRCRSRTMKVHDCPEPGIAASLLDGPVWQRVCDLLRDPQMIAAEVARHRVDGGLDRELASVERVLSGAADKQARIAKRLAAIDDDDVAAPLMAELQTLAGLKRDAERQREELLRRIANREEEAANLRTLTEWCRTVAANLDGFSYDEKRLALQALGVEVRVWAKDAHDAAGNRLPRWELDAKLLTPPPAFLSQTPRCSLQSARASTTLLALRCSETDGWSALAPAHWPGQDEEFVALAAD